jgi:hypothetical protein
MKTYRNDINEVSSFLNEHHRFNYMIWNLCEIQYDCTKFDNQVLKMGKRNINKNKRIYRSF